MLKGDYGTYKEFSISVTWEPLPESGRREMQSLPWTQICREFPPIPFTPLVESIKYDNRFWLLTMTLFVPVSIMYNWISESETKHNGLILRNPRTGVKDCTKADGGSLVNWECGWSPVILLMKKYMLCLCIDELNGVLSFTRTWIAPDMA